jgi:hypothetical protein
VRSLIVKELRQASRWALAGGLALAAAFAFAVFNLERTSGEVSLASQLVQMITVIGYPLLGLALGLAQVLPERQGNQWAFLVHRPVSRGRVFAAKVSAGLLIYLIVGFAPLLLAAGWVAAPGHVAAPFSLASLGPSLADMLSGVGWYLGGLLVAARPARWYGSRALPLGAAFLGSTLSLGAPSIGWACLGSLLAIGVLGMAAWGSFHGDGSYAPAPRPARLALSASVGAGASLLLLLGLTMVASLVVNGDRGEPWEYERYHLDRSGQMVVVTETDLGPRAVVDLEGRPLADHEVLDRGAQVGSEGLPSSTLSYHPGMMVSERVSYRSASDQFTRLDSGIQQRAAYFDPRERLILVYDQRSKLLEGRLGASGWAAVGDGVPRPFPGTLLERVYNNPLLVFEGGVYRLDLRRLKIDTVFEPDQGDVILATGLAWGTPDTPPPLVLTSGGLFQVTADGDSVRVDAPDIDEALARETPAFEVQVGHLPEGSGEAGLVVVVRAFESQAMSRCTTDGRFLDRTSLPSLDSQRMVMRSDYPARAYGLPLPLVGIAGAWALVQASEAGVIPIGPRGVADEVSLILGRFATGALLAALLSLFGVLWLSRRHSLTRTEQVGWSLWTLAMGPAGLLTFLGVRDWPVLEACPGCATARRVDSERCPRCDAPWPEPGRDGTEVFDHEHQVPSPEVAESAEPALA